MTAPVLLMCPLYEPTQRELEATWTVHRHYSNKVDRAALMASLADTCEVIVTGSSRGVEPEVMRQLPRLKLVSNFGVGIDAIDLAWCREHGIAVTNTPDVLTDDVADMAVALMLASLRQVACADRWIREGKWTAIGGFALTRQVRGRRVGIVGLGRIGAAIAQRCAAFGTELAWHGPHRKPVDLPWHADLLELARWADVLIAACPGGDQTRGLISREVLEALGPEGHFINIARGSVVDQPALIELLQQGRLGGAGLDVFADEPRVPAELIALPQVVLQPHHGSGTRETRTGMGRLTIDNVAAFLANRPLLTPVS